jgi:hypothetical protein
MSKNADKLVPWSLLRQAKHCCLERMQTFVIPLPLSVRDRWDQGTKDAFPPLQATLEDVTPIPSIVDYVVGSEKVNSSKVDTFSDVRAETHNDSSIRMHVLDS